MKKYILAHDLGTSGDKAILYDLNGRLCASLLHEYETFYPRVNWVEQNPEDWWKAVCISTKRLMEKAGISPEEVCCISFSAQMMGCIPVDREGVALRRSLIWADMRGTTEAHFMEKTLGMENIYKITGHRIGASYTAAKILWIKENEPDIYRRTYKVLNTKDFIILKLTGKFVTDYSDASGTNLLDIRSKVWSDDIIKEINIRKDMLPEIHASTDIAGGVTRDAAIKTGLLEGTPVVIGGGDGSCATVGAGAVEEGSVYCALGTSAWISLASDKPIFDDKMCTFNFVHLDKELYSPCGTMQSAGNSYKWLKNTLCGIESAEAIDKNISPYELINNLIEKSKPGANNLLFLPYLMGERSPRWNPDAKGAFVGLNITHSKEDMYRSVLEGITFNLKVILDVYNRVLPIEKVIAIGGGAKGNTWLQILADIWHKDIQVPAYLEEATSIGAVICGGVGVGAFSDFKVVKNFNSIEKIIKPREEYREKYNKLFEIFNDTYNSLVPVYDKLSRLD